MTDMPQDPDDRRNNQPQLFGRGWAYVSESGHWLEAPGPKLHPADAVRIVIANTTPDGYRIAGLVLEFGWERFDLNDGDKRLAKNAEEEARSQIAKWLSSSELLAWNEHGDIDPRSWRKFDFDAASSWWPVDAPNQGRWWTSKSDLLALISKIKSSEERTSAIDQAEAGSKENAQPTSNGADCKTILPLSAIDELLTKLTPNQKLVVRAVIELWPNHEYPKEKVRVTAINEHIRKNPANASVTISPSTIYRAIRSLNNMTSL